MFVFNCTSKAAEFFAKTPDNESVKIIAPPHDDISLDAEYQRAEYLKANDDNDSNWGSHWNMDPMQWQLDVKHDTEQDNAKQYLVCCETESKFSLYFEYEQVTTANQVEDDDITEMLSTIDSLKQNYHCYLRELKGGVTLTDHFEAVYKANLEPITKAQQDSEELAEDLDMHLTMLAATM